VWARIVDEELLVVHLDELARARESRVTG